MNYPEVVGEWDTLIKVMGGESIARYGDGELKIMQGRRCVSQMHTPELAEELKEIIGAEKSKAIVGIPTIDVRSPKYELWNGMKKKFTPFLNRRATYYSSFITRPDSAPWIGIPEFFDNIESLWKDQKVTFVGNGERSLTPKFLMDTGAKHVDWVGCTYAHSYPQIDWLVKEAVRQGNHRVLLCVGPTATCMAERLARLGHHAIDLGHIGMFWRRYADFATWREQREINKETGKVEPNP
jgi:hypothetical protein